MMLTFPPVPEVTVIGVHEPGVPNRERVVLRVETTLNLGAYALIAAWGAGGASGTPLHDHFFWLGNHVVQGGTLILVYTCAGVQTTGVIPQTSQAYIAMHWGKRETVFNRSSVIPVLMHVDRLGFVFDPAQQAGPALPAYTPRLPLSPGTVQ